MRLYLIRHAQTAWNVEGKAQGHTDIPLDEVGVAQAIRLGEAMRGVSVARVFSSDLARCLDTARAVHQATGGEFVVDERLRERNLGEWEGMPFQDIRGFVRDRKATDDEHGVHVRPVGGESPRDVWNRLEPLTQAWKSIEEPIAVVSHGAACALILAQLLNGDPITARGFRFGNASITELFRNDEGLFVMDRYNDGAHHRERPLAGNLDGAHK